MTSPRTCAATDRPRSAWTKRSGRFHPPRCQSRPPCPMRAPAPGFVVSQVFLHQDAAPGSTKGDARRCSGSLIPLTHTLRSAALAPLLGDVQRNAAQLFPLLRVGRSGIHAGFLMDLAFAFAGVAGQREIVLPLRLIPKPVLQ